MGFDFPTRHLTGQQRAIIRNREENNERLKKESEKREQENEKSKTNKILFKLDFTSKTYKRLGTIEINDTKNIEVQLIPVCKKYQQDIKEGQWLYVAVKCQNGILPMYRATYTETDEESNELPYYIDVAEYDERVMFCQLVKEGIVNKP